MDFLTSDWSQVTWIGSPLMGEFLLHTLNWLLRCGTVWVSWSTSFGCRLDLDWPFGVSGSIALVLLYNPYTFFLRFLPYPLKLTTILLFSVGWSAYLSRICDVLLDPYTRSILYQRKLPPRASLNQSHFTLSTCTVVHAALYHGQSLLNGLKKMKVETDDIHTKLMRNYSEVAEWWYVGATVLAAFIQVGVKQ